MARKQASIATIRQNISHLRKQVSRIKAMKVQAPSRFDEPVTVRRRGSQLFINGELYKAGDLEKLKGQSRNWQLPVLAELEQKLAEEEYRLVRRGKTPRKLTAITKLEQRQAEAGIDMITSEELMEFDNWLNEGSSGFKKNLYYHEYGARTINRGDVNGFLSWYAGMTGVETISVTDLPIDIPKGAIM